MWIQSKKDQGEEFQQHLKDMIEKYMAPVLKVKKLKCSELVKSSETACVINMCHLFDALCLNLRKAEDEDFEAFKNQIEKWFVFSLIWSVGATVEENSRKEIDLILRDLDSLFPH
jgi:dynein heavy chain